MSSANDVARATKWNREHKERRHEIQKKSAAKNAEGLRISRRRTYPKNRPRVKRWCTENAERVWGHNLKRYGITPEEYAAMLSAQGGLCAICKAPPGARRLAVDHDHATGKVRGLLCNGCNSIIGLAGEDVSRLILAGKYILIHGQAE